MKQIVFIDNNALDWFAVDDGKIYSHLPKEHYKLYIINQVKYEFEYPRSNEKSKKIQKSAAKIISEYPIEIFKPFGFLSSKDIKCKKQDDISNDEAHYGGWDEGFLLPNSVIEFLNSDLVKDFNQRSRDAALKKTGLRKNQADIMLAALSTAYPVLTNETKKKSILSYAKRNGYQIIYLKKEIEVLSITVHNYLTSVRDKGGIQAR